MKTVSSIIDDIIRIEGGYSNDPNDKGGETCYGITAAVARASGYMGPMQDLPLDVARAIYNKRYVTIPCFDQVAAIDTEIGVELIDTGVNMGPASAAMFLQRWLNGFNYAGRYQELFVDGRIGRITLDALVEYLAWRKEEGRIDLLKGLNCIQGARYLDLVEKDRSQRKWLSGWLRQRVVMP